MNIAGGHETVVWKPLFMYASVTGTNQNSQVSCKTEKRNKEKSDFVFY